MLGLDQGGTAVGVSGQGEVGGLFAREKIYFAFDDERVDLKGRV